MLSGFVAEILTKAFKREDNPYYVEDSFAFSIFINNFQLPEGYVIVSLDVISLFTNIPVDLCKTV